jgi:hypothetical protein
MKVAAAIAVPMSTKYTPAMVNEKTYLFKNCFIFKFLNDCHPKAASGFNSQKSVKNDLNKQIRFY